MFRPIEILKLRPHIAEAFADDNSLIGKYHVLEYPEFNEMVSHTFNAILEANKQFECTAYVDHFGYVVFLGDILYSFGIKKSLRTRKNKEKFINFVASKSNRCYLWSKNERAIRFLCQSGYAITQEFEDGGKKFVELCQLQQHL